MRGLKAVADPRPSHPPTGPEVIIRPKPDEASRLGVSVQSIAQVARVATLGDIDANVPKLTEGERRIPIRIRLPASARDNLAIIRALPVPTASGGTTPLDSVADISFEAGPSSVYRYDRKRDIAIDADLANGAQLGQAMKEINNTPLMRSLGPPPKPGLLQALGGGIQRLKLAICKPFRPKAVCDRIPQPQTTQQLPPRYPGVEQVTNGQTEQFVELFSQIGMAILTGVSMIYAVLVLLFRSFFKPLIILSALPMAVGGAFLGLMAMRLAISIPSLIGLLMLMGLAAKNSILLVEYAIEREREGMSQRMAIMEACRERARPIIMTSMAMAAGMLPTALAIGKGSEFRQPMAVAVIGGLITSTVLSLIMVPVVYEMIDDLEHWLAPRLARFITPVEAPPVPAPEDRL
jgi:HAE1 family hydrophobic/amphiphilic exporter-1